MSEGERCPVAYWSMYHPNEKCLFRHGHPGPHRTSSGASWVTSDRRVESQETEQNCPAIVKIGDKTTKCVRSNLHLDMHVAGSPVHESGTGILVRWEGTDDTYRTYTVRAHGIWFQDEVTGKRIKEDDPRNPSAEKERKIMQHFHVNTGTGNEETDLITADVAEFADYLSDELSNMADFLHEGADSLADAGLYKEAWEMLTASRLATDLSANFNYTARSEAPLYKNRLDLLDQTIVGLLNKNNFFGSHGWSLSAWECSDNCIMTADTDRQ